MFISSVSDSPGLAIGLNQRVFSFNGITIPGFLMTLLVLGVIIIYSVFELITRICLQNINKFNKNYLNAMFLEINSHVFFMMIVWVVVVWLLTAVQMEALGWYSMSTGSMGISIIQVDGLAHCSQSNNEVDLITQITQLIQIVKHLM